MQHILSELSHYFISELFGESEIRNLNVSLFGKKNIFRLEISIDDLKCFVEVLNTKYDFSNDELRHLFREGVHMSKQRKYLSSGNVFHDQINLLLSLYAVLQRNYERMRRAKQNCFLENRRFDQLEFNNVDFLYRFHRVLAFRIFLRYEVHLSECSFPEWTVDYEITYCEVLSTRITLTPC